MVKIKAIMSGSNVVSNASESMALHNKSRFGEIVKGKVKYSLVEALYLMQISKMEVHANGKKLSENKFTELATKQEKDFVTRSAVFSDLRDKGYVVKTALKFGADFRVYEKGKKPGEAHAKWIVFSAKEGKSITWREFAAKNRVAHSTKKNLLIGIVDDEGAVTYYEIFWRKP